MIHKTFISNSAAWDFIDGQLKATNENNSNGKTIIWNNGLNEESLVEIVESGVLNKIFESNGEVTKQFVILMGGPSTGKGFLVDTRFGEGFGLINGKTMKDWLDIEQVTTNDVHEGDSILREIQKGIAIISFNRLYNAAIAAGKNGFNSAIREIFYTTKDGNKNKLSDHLTYHEFMTFLSHSDDLGGEASSLAHDVRIEKKELRKLQAEKNSEEEKKVPDQSLIDELASKIKAIKNSLNDKRKDLQKVVGDLFLESMKDPVFNFDDFLNEYVMPDQDADLPIKRLKSILHQSRSAEPKSEEAFDEFYEATKAPFWKSMRGWKKDGAYGIERFKEASRKEFEKIIKEKPGTNSSLFGGNIIVVDSPGEDVAKQPYVAECIEAEKAGYVTNIINLDPKLGGDMVSLMRISNLNRNVSNGDRMVDDSDITGYSENVGDAIASLHAHKYPRGSVHRYFHLVRDIDDKEDIIKIIGAMYGAIANKDEFIYPQSIADENGAPRENVTFRELNKAISEAGVSIKLASKIKAQPTLLEWWKENVRKVIFGINPVVLYTIKHGENNSFNIEMDSSDILSGVSDRLSKVDDEFDNLKQEDYNKMIRSVQRWTKEYTEWTDKDTWKALTNVVKVRESKVLDFNEYIKKSND